MGARWKIRSLGPPVGLGAILCLLVSPGAAAAAWLPPVAASETGATASEPRIVVDAAGNATIVWTSGSAPTRSIRSAFRPAGGEWGESSSRIGSSFDCHDPRLAANAAGAAALVAECESPASIRAAYRPGAFWSGAVEVPGSGAGEAARVGIDAGANAVAVWAGPGSTVQAASRPAAGSWSADGQLSTAGKVALRPNLGMNATGYAHAIWRENREGYAGDPVVDVRTSRRELSGSWTSSSRLTSNFGPGSTTPVTGGEPQIDVSASGQRMLAWTLLGAKESLQSRSSFSDFAGFSEPFSSVVEAGSNVEIPQTAVGGPGLGTAAWRSDNNGSGFLIRAATTSSLAGAWSSPATLAGPAGLSIGTEPVVAADPAGNATVVWNAGNDIGAASRSAAGGFTPSVVISNTTHPGFGRPQVEMSSSGDALAVWAPSANHIAFVVDDVTPPTISYTPPVPVVAGNAVGLTALAIDTWSTTTLSWDFGDGATATGTQVSHIYAGAGAKTATVTATDAAGNSAQVSIPIIVTSAPPAKGLGAGVRPKVSLAARVVSQPWKQIAKAKALKLSCRLDVSGSCAAVASVGASVARRIGLKVGKRKQSVAVGKGSIQARAGRFTVVRIKLTAKVLAAIAAARKPVPVTIAVTASAAGRDPASLIRKLKISRP